MSSLLLAEYGYQVRDFIDRGLGDQSHWVALGPSAMACLDDVGVDYQIPEDFYSGDELDEFCNDTHAQVENLIDGLDQCLINSHPELKSLGMAPFRFYIFPLLMIFDAVRARVFQLQKIFEAYPEHTIYMHNGAESVWKPPDLLFSNKETLWGRVASLSGWNLSLEILPDPGLHDDTHNRDSTVKRRIRKSLMLTSAARLLAFRNYRALLNLIRTDREALLLVNAPYEWAHILPRLSQGGRRILFVSEEYFRNQATDEGDAVSQRGFEQLESDPVMMSCLSLGGVDYYPLMKDRLSWIWQSSPRQFALIAHKVTELKKRYKISILLRCSSASGVDHAINQSARLLGTPVLVWQHGAVSYYERITQFRDYADLMTSDYLFVYGSDVEEAYRSYGREFSAQVIPIGAPSLDSIARSSDDARKVPKCRERKQILYATTNYMQNHWYCGWKPAYSIRHLFRDQLVITNYLRAAARAGLVEVVVKLHPSPEYQDPPWAASLSNVKWVRVVKDEESLESLLLQSDAVVLDFPSTTLLQSLATGLPVFLLTRHWLFSDEVSAMLRKRVVAADNAEELAGLLREFLESGVYLADLEESSFLRGHGTYLNDGKSGTRALETLSRIADGGFHRATSSGVEKATLMDGKSQSL